MARVPALLVKQWLPAWDSFSYSVDARQRKPEAYFYMASVPAGLLRRLAGFRRRKATGPRALDIGIQRAHDEDRSSEIARFIEAGHPWASLNTRDQERFPDLRKPGWLPTAIIANLVTKRTRRSGQRPDDRDLITVRKVDPDRVDLVLPSGSDKSDWAPKGKLYPIEIIDGQHRLLAVQGKTAEAFELPVVFFLDLDISWQAYLFWTINITPKRISPSFAYDLFPLLRTEDWLQKIEGPRTYRETRAQELTEVLWSHRDSPWKGRIAMLGREKGKVTQAAWVRSLTVSFVRQWETGRSGPGGLFGVELPDPNFPEQFLWSRTQQAAYLLKVWTDVANAIAQSEESWVRDVRAKSEDYEHELDAGFAGPYSLLNTEQGVRGVLHVANDISFALAGPLSLAKWQHERATDPIDLDEVTRVLRDLRRQRTISEFTKRLARQVAKFDWRTASTPGLLEDVRNQQALYRAGTGYREVRRHLLRLLSRCTDRQIASTAQSVIADLGYE